MLGRSVIDGLARRAIRQLISAACLLACSVGSAAAPIVGDINFGGSVALTGGTTLDTATGLDFIDAPRPLVVKGFSTGSSFSGLVSVGDAADFTDFTFDLPDGTPFQEFELWRVGQFSFRLTEEPLKVFNATEDKLTLQGTGVVLGDGFDSTFGDWTLSVRDRTTEFKFFSSSSTASGIAIPEAGTLWLLGVGLAGLGTFVRRDRRGQARGQGNTNGSQLV